MNFSRFRYFYLGLALVLMVAAIGVIATYGFRLGIDFTGGALWEVSIEQPVTNERLASTLGTAIGDTVEVAVDASSGHFLVRIGDASPEVYGKVRQIVSEQFGTYTEHSYQSIGPSVSGKLRTGAFLAIFMVLLLISLYIVFSFRKANGPVGGWAYGVATLLSLFHDVAIPAVVIGVLGHYGQVEVDTNFIVALLVIMGFSVHDTIVVFDRIRENVGTMRGSFAEIVNASVRQTLARSLNTSFTLVLVLVALLILGPATLYYFVLILLIGVLTGAYSSIFVASPVLLTLARQAKRK
jgi:preprotein translocase subunit SecF